MTKLTFSKTRKILILLFALFLSGGFGAGFFHFLLTEPHSVVTWAIMFPLFVIFAVISVLDVRQAFFGFCSFDDNGGIEFYYGFAKRVKIPDSALEGFFPMTDGIDIRYKKIVKGEEKIKSLRVPSEFQNIHSLYEWLSERARNLYAEQVKASVQEFKAEHSELSDEEKAVFLAKTYRIARILKWLGVAIAVLFFASLFKGGRLKQIAFVVCAAYPILLFLLLRVSNGAFRFDSGNADVHPSLFAPFCYCAGVLCLSATGYIESIYSLSKMFGISAIAALCAFGVYLAFASDSEKNVSEKSSAKLILLACSFVVFFIYGFGVAVTVNILFDSSQPVVYEASVLNQRVSYGKHTDYYLDVSPWIDGKTDRKEISVGRKLYEKSETDDIVDIKLYKGKLGIPYFRVASSAQNKEN